MSLAFVPNIRQTLHCIKAYLSSLHFTYINMKIRTYFQCLKPQLEATPPRLVERIPVFYQRRRDRFSLITQQPPTRHDDVRKATKMAPSSTEKQIKYEEELVEEAKKAKSQWHLPGEHKSTRRILVPTHL